jgi:hypothetical protein
MNCIHTSRETGYWNRDTSAFVKQRATLKFQANGDVETAQIPNFQNTLQDVMYSCCILNKLDLFFILELKSMSTKE